MRSMLDVNVVIALLDADHAFHERAYAWWATHANAGWASCPITENGVVRVMSNPAYSAATRFAPATLISRLRTFVRETDHEFWADDVSVRDETAILAERIHGSRQLTELYLLALAVRHQGRLATFDQSIPASAVPGAKARHLSMV